MRRECTGSIVSAVTGIIIVAGLTYYLADNSPNYVPLLQVSAIGAAGILVLSLTIPVINGLINVYLFSMLGVGLTFREGFHLAATATLANQLPLPGGLVARGAYLRGRHDLAVPKYLSAMAALFICTVSADGLIATALLSYWGLIGAGRPPVTLFTAFAVMAAAGLVFLIPVWRARLPGIAGQWLQSGVRGWRVIGGNIRGLFRLIALQTCFMLVFALRLWVAFHMVSQDISYGQAILLACGSMLTQLASFAPGGIGVREAIVGGIATALGFDLIVSIAAVELDRLLSTATILIVGGFSTWMLTRRISAAAAFER
jgi:hypothetical protein